MSNKQRIIIGMSGGVDSAVAALLLKQQGYDVIGVFMRNWEEEDENGVCTAEEDYSQVKSVCGALDIPYYTVNFTRQYWDRVFTYFLEEYKRGRTPNPDVMCNKEIKFAEFLNFAIKLEADKLATGHYAGCEHNQDGYFLKRAADKGKDQTYFLYNLGQGQLSRVMFPLADIQKSDVRALAAQTGLSNAQRKDSTGICFIGERNFRRFLSQYLPAQPGEIIDLDTGKNVGKHDGLMYYTRGQRKGIGIGGEGGAWYAAAKDLENNRLMVVQGKDHPALYSMRCRASGLSWVSGEFPDEGKVYGIKTRYRQPDQPARIIKQGDELIAEFLQPVRAVTPGQALVVYDGEYCLGGGTIDEYI